MFNDICNNHAPYREIKIGRQSLPWITPQIRHLMNLRYKTLLRAKRLNNQHLWAEYRSLRNTVTNQVRTAKTEFYMSLFNEVKDCKTYWNLVKKAAYSPSSQPILGIRKSDGSIETSDYSKAQILNDYFSTVGENLVNDLPILDNQETGYTLIDRVTPCIMDINLSHAEITNSLNKLKPNKASGSDNVASKLLKLAGEALTPSLTSLYSISAACNSVPASWQTANVSALYKKDDVTDKQNYRPISLLSIPGKLMETAVSRTITTHLSDHNLGNSHQWAYKKGHSTELLQVKMVEDWRCALDKNLIVGIVFVDFRKAFDSIPHDQFCSINCRQLVLQVAYGPGLRIT